MGLIVFFYIIYDLFNSNYIFFQIHNNIYYILLGNRFFKNLSEYFYFFPKYFFFNVLRGKFFYNLNYKDCFFSFFSFKSFKFIFKIALENKIFLLIFDIIRFNFNQIYAFIFSILNQSAYFESTKLKFYFLLLRKIFKHNIFLNIFKSSFLNFSNKKLLKFYMKKLC